MYKNIEPTEPKIISEETRPKIISKEIEETQEICSQCDGIGTTLASKTMLSDSEETTCKRCKGTGYRVTKRVIRYTEW